MASGGKVLSWIWLESSGLRLAGTYLLSYLTLDHFDPCIGAISEAASIRDQMSSGVQSET
jgi:hypothetical protein